jgi:hypothetical protein
MFLRLIEIMLVTFEAVEGPSEAEFMSGSVGWNVSVHPRGLV